MKRITIYFFIGFIGIVLNSCKIQNQEKSNSEEIAAMFFLDVLNFYIYNLSISAEVIKNAYFKNVLILLKEVRLDLETNYRIKTSKNAIIHFFEKHKNKIEEYHSLDEKEELFTKLDSIKLNLFSSSKELLEIKNILATILSSGADYTTNSLPKITLLYGDTLVLKANKFYSFSFKIEENGHNLLIINDVVENGHQIENPQIKLKTPAYSTEIIKEEVKVVLRNQLTRENEDVYKEIWIKLEK